MALENTSQTGSRPANVVTRDQLISIPANRHLPRLFRHEQTDFRIGSQSKKGRCVLLFCPDGKPTHVLSSASPASTIERRSRDSPSYRVLSPDGDASSTNAPISKSDTSVTTFCSKVNSEQDVKLSRSNDTFDLSQSGGGLLQEDKSFGGVTLLQQDNDKESILKQLTEKSLIDKMGPQDVNVLEKNEYLIELCQKYKSSCKETEELAGKIIDWVHGKGGNFVIPSEGVFTVAPFSTVHGFLQRMIESTSRLRSRASMSPKTKLIGGKNHASNKNKTASFSKDSLEMFTISAMKSGSLAPGKEDVICGRGNGCSLHTGNM